MVPPLLAVLLLLLAVLLILPPPQAWPDAMREGPRPNPNPNPNPSPNQRWVDVMKEKGKAFLAGESGIIVYLTQSLTRRTHPNPDPDPDP